MKYLQLSATNFICPYIPLRTKQFISLLQAMVDVAKEVGADAVAHGCTGKGNDQVHTAVPGNVNMGSHLMLSFSVGSL